MEDWVAWLIIGLIAALIVASIMYWYITLPVVAVCLLIYYARKANKEEEARREAERRRIEDHQREQQKRRQQIAALGTSALDLFEASAREFVSTESHLDQAEQNFSEGLFDPFWDSIEGAVGGISRFRSNVSAISGNATTYIQLVDQVEGERPGPFPLVKRSIDALGDIDTTVSRLKAIVRESQKDVHYTTIYHQRKTNQILLAGFGSLREALDDMSERVAMSIHELANTVERSAERSAARVESSIKGLKDQAAEFHRETTQPTENEIRRQADTLNMLENARRGRVFLT